MRAERPCTFVRRHEREGAMARRKLTVDRYAAPVPSTSTQEILDL